MKFDVCVLCLLYCVAPKVGEVLIERRVEMKRRWKGWACGLVGHGQSWPICLRPTKQPTRMMEVCCDIIQLILKEMRNSRKQLL